MKINNNPIYILGDIHGQFLKAFTSFQDSDCNIIQVGDLGIFSLYDLDVLNAWNEWFQERNIHFYSIRGNHDNPKLFVGNFDLNTNIHLIEDYSILQQGPNNIICIGGAISIDRRIRVEGKDYWKDENVNSLNYTQEFIDFINNNKITAVITHCSPNLLPPFGESNIVNNYAVYDSKLKEDIYSEKLLLQRVMNLLLLKTEDIYWYYGHYHRSEIFKFQNINSCILNIDEYKLAPWSYEENW